MFTPAVFAETRRDVLLDAISAKSFGTLITYGGTGIELTHLPFVIDGDEIIGHVARANPQWENTLSGAEAVASFVIDDAYIHPGWYPSKQDHGKTVPTWNYIAVEARGPIEWLHEAGQLEGLLRKVTDRHESHRPVPWELTDAPADYIQRLLRGIVGFRLKASQLAGVWKLSQNKDERDRAGVANGVSSEHPGSAIANLMQTP